MKCFTRTHELEYLILTKGLKLLVAKTPEAIDRLVSLLDLSYAEFDDFEDYAVSMLEFEGTGDIAHNLSLDALIEHYKSKATYVETPTSIIVYEVYARN